MCTQSANVLVEYLPTGKPNRPVSAKAMNAEILARVKQGGFDGSTEGSWWAKTGATVAKFDSAFVSKHAKFLHKQLAGYFGDESALPEHQRFSTSSWAAKLLERALKYENAEEKRRERARAKEAKKKEADAKRRGAKEWKQKGGGHGAAA